MHTKQVTTKAGANRNGLEVEYPVTVQLFDSAVEALTTIPELDPEGDAAEAIAVALGPYEEKLQAVVGVINSAQKQGATQGPKQQVRDVLDKLRPFWETDEDGNKVLMGVGWEEDGEEESAETPRGILTPDTVPALATAVHDAQIRGEKYVIGAPRGISVGITKTQLRKQADEVQKLGPEAQAELQAAYEEIMSRHGL